MPSGHNGQGPEHGGTVDLMQNAIEYKGGGDGEYHHGNSHQGGHHEMLSLHGNGYRGNSHHHQMKPLQSDGNHENTVDEMLSSHGNGYRGNSHHHQMKPLQSDGNAVFMNIQ